MILGAMSAGSKDRYGQGDVDEMSKLVPEGIEGQVPYRGSLSSNIYQLLVIMSEWLVQDRQLYVTCVKTLYLCTLLSFFKRGAST